MKPELHFLGLNIKTFGIFFALNFAAWGLLAARRLRELGKPQDWAYEMVLVAIAGGLVGARLYYVIQHYDDVKHHLVSGLFGGAGLVWYGGLLGGVITVLIWARWRGFLSLALLDLAGPCLALGYAVGRIGCQVSGDGDYGVHSGLPWAMAYPHGEVPTTTEVHPTPIYETLSMGFVAFGLWQLRDRVRPGGLFALYLVFAGLERFLVEFVRRNADVALGLTGAQLESLALLVGGAIWLALILRRGDGLLLGTARRSALA
jgi:phosphatidylglycerol:prolipoprotein diacylglycerol transferase